MAITDIPIFSMLRTKMNWNQERQKVLAENVANSDTPNYRERDLVPPKFEEPRRNSPSGRCRQVALAKTERGHIGGMTLERRHVFRDTRARAITTFARPAIRSTSKTR